MIKKLALGVVALVVLVIVGGVLLLTNMDSIIKGVIEKYGTEATQAPVRLDHVTLALASGKGELDGLTIGNPKGFSSAKSFTLGTVSLQLDTSSVQGDGPIVIKEVLIDKPQITYELLNSGDSNLQTIQHNTQTYATAMAGSAGHGGKGGADTSGAGADKAAGGKPARKIIIENLTVSGGQVQISQQLLKGKNLSTSLPDIHLTDIGKQSNGATIAQVTQQVLGSIANAAASSAVAELAKQKIQGAIKDVPAGAIGGAALDNVGNQLKGVFGQ